MPIIRTYGCLECGQMFEVTLPLDQWEAPEPDCPSCSARTQQHFKPFGITGSPSRRAHDIAEEIVTSDYHAADFQRDWRRESTPAVRYKDQGKTDASSWSGIRSGLEQAIAIGRHTRTKYGNGLDVLKTNLKSGAEPDLIKNSKKQSIKVW